VFTTCTAKSNTDRLHASNIGIYVFCIDVYSIGSIFLLALKFIFITGTDCTVGVEFLNTIQIIFFLFFRGLHFENLITN